MIEIKEVWIFNGENSRFPSAVFQAKEDAIEWIKKHGLTGVLTRYPVGVSVYDWAIDSGNFKVKSEKDSAPEFIGRFSSSAQEYMHFEDGIFD